MFIWVEAITAANPSNLSAYTTKISGLIFESASAIDKTPVPIAWDVANGELSSRVISTSA